MTLQQITASDVSGWNSLDDIASSLEKRGLKTRPNLGEENELVLQLSDDEFVVLVSAGPGESATDFKPENRSRHTNLVATNDFEEFTFLTRMRSWEGQQHGRIKHQKISFTKDQFERESGEKHTILKKLNSIEYGSSAAIYDTLYDTQQVVKEFYEDFEKLRTDLVQEVSGIPDDRGDAKKRYVQVVLDRMIFLYFIQEKRLLDRNPNYLHKQPEKVVDDGGDRYENFYRPLFFDYLAEDKQNPDFGSLPYLNGGLFAKNPVEGDFPDAKLGESAEETNQLFDDILDFLSDWNWNVDERLDIVDPKNLSPAILGHIFEQTVNQKEMGAYYTPEEITGFMSRRTIHPYLLDQLNNTANTNYEEIDELFAFPGSGTSTSEKVVINDDRMTQQVDTNKIDIKHVETLYHDILKEVHVLDPAVGSGAFLLAAQDVLVDIYIQCIEFFQQLEEEGKGWELDSRTRDELEEINKGQGGPSLYAKRKVILNNLYGVDIDEGAVEICKLRLWLSMVADIEDEPNEVEPLPNIDFNVRHGNSLIGFTDLVEVSNEGYAQLSNWGGGSGTSVKDLYEDIIKAIKRHRDATSSRDATNARKLAESKIESHSKELDEKVLEQFHSAGLDDLSLGDIREYHPLHWVLEFAPVYEDGGFDVVIGNPPWDQVKPKRDEFFVQYEPEFRSLSLNERDKVEERLLDDEEIKRDWEEYKRSSEVKSTFFTKSNTFKLQSPKVDGRSRSAANDLSALFLERMFQIADDSGYVAQVLPGLIWQGLSTKDLRNNLLTQTTINSLAVFENKGTFDNIDDRFQFGVVTFKNEGETRKLKGIFKQQDVSILQDFENNAFDIPREVLANYSPEAGIFPQIRSRREVEILEKMVDHPAIGSDTGSWIASPYMELRQSTDSDRLFEEEHKGDYPVIGGSNIYQYSYNSQFFDLEDPDLWSVEETDPEKSAKRRIREKKKRVLKSELYETFDGTGSKKGFVNDLLEGTRGSPLSIDDVLLDCTEYRIVYRRIANATNERGLIATVIPPGVVCHDGVYTVQPYTIEPSREDLNRDNLHSSYKRIFTDSELFTCLGLINSIPFDFLIRTKIDTTIPVYKFEETQVPHLTNGDDWFEYISTRAALLNCYGDGFKEMRNRLNGISPVSDKTERREIQAEIDAAALHAYGLNRKDAEFMLNDFHQVSNPRMMTQEYFDLVYKKYNILKQEEPKP